MIGRPRLLIDTREQTPWRFSDGVDVEVVSLETGDYSVAGATDTVAIERKSLADFVMCVGPERERFMDCCRRLRDYALRAVIIEASIEDVMAQAYRSRTRPSSVIGTSVAIHVDYGVPTLWAGDAMNAANIAERLLVRVWNKHVARAA
ncbi:MAG TPA: ERCC4 domain-containing protein [Polyangiaceae bacterium]|nr:ERCC4 domain-containing protein [Polyangiaceae bacterium]